MRPRTLLILLAIVLGLGAFIWFYERELPSSEEREQLAKRVFDVEKDDITAVSLQSEGRTVRLEKVKTDKDSKDEKDDKDNEDELDLEPEEEWRLTQPVQARADSFAVNGLLDSLTALEQTRELAEVDPKEAGLDRPRATVRLQTEKGETVLAIGAADPLSGGSTLAAVQGRKGAYVVSDSILTEIQRQPGDWRDKQMYRGNRDDVRRITLASGGRRVVLAAQGKDKGTYRIGSPLSDRVDGDKVDGLFAELSGLMAESFLDAPARPLAELGLQPPEAVVDVAFDESPPVRIEVGNPVDTPASPEETPAEAPLAGLVYARIGDQVFETRTRLAEAAARPAAEWRAQTLSALDVFEVESATAQDATGALSLQRADPDWKRGTETISYLPVSDFLFALVGARADRLLAPAEAGAMGISLAKPALTVTLKTKEKGQEVLTLYPAVAAGVPARASGRNVVLLLPASTLGEIQGKLAEVRKAKPMTAN